LSHPLDVTYDLHVLAGELAVCRLPPTGGLPDWATGSVVAWVRTADRSTLVASSACVPAEVRSEGPWRALEVEGPLAFSLVGVLASLLAPLAAAGVPVFVLSEFETDLVLVPGGRVEEAVAALRQAGHRVETPEE